MLAMLFDDQSVSSRNGQRELLCDSQRVVEFARQRVGVELRLNRQQGQHEWWLFVLERGRFGAR